MNAEKLLMVLHGAHTSEKSTIIAEKLNQYVFKVQKNATKNEIKLAVENAFNVQVENVNILNVKGKLKKFRQSIGKRNDWKKAIVTIASNQIIDLSI